MARGPLKSQESMKERGRVQTTGSVAKLQLPQYYLFIQSVLVVIVALQ